MTRNPITIPPDVSIAEAMEWMRREKVRRFPVVDKKLNIFLGEDPSNWGCTLKVGDITMDDLLEAIKPHVLEITDIRET